MAITEGSPLHHKLVSAVETLKKYPNNPEIVTASFHAIWQVRAEQLKREGIIITLPGDGYTQEELAQLEADGRRPGYLPPELATQETRYLWDILYFELKSQSVYQGNSVTNEENLSGWFDYEVTIDAPFINTTEDELRVAIQKQGRKEMNLNLYIAASEDSKLLEGHYLDERATWARLLGSGEEGSVIGARFAQHGRLIVASRTDPLDRDSYIGGRSVGTPTAK